MSSAFTEREEGNVLFNETLNTFNLRLYGVRQMAKDHTDSERGNPLPPHGLLFPTDSVTHTTTFVTPVVQHLLEREIQHAQSNLMHWARIYVGVYAVYLKHVGSILTLPFNDYGNKHQILNVRSNN